MSALFLLVPLACVLLLNLPGVKLGSRVALGLAASFCAAQAASILAVPHPEFWNRYTLGYSEAFSVTSMFRYRFPVDSISLVMFLCIGIVGLCAALVAQYSLGRELRFRFSNLLFLIVAGMNGVTMVRDLFTLYVFLEITAIASFIFISMESQGNGYEGAFKYMILSAVATALLLAGLALLFIVAGETSFEVVRSALDLGRAEPMVHLAMALFLGGLAIKAGVIPFHGWVPDAYTSAPAAVSVMLGGIITKIAGVYTFIRLIDAVFGYLPPVQNTLFFLGLVSIVGGALLALVQKDFKRMLAYSSISQVGYIFLGLGSATALGLAGAVFHFFNHSIFKSLLFVNAAAVESQSGTREMNKLGGIGKKMPVTGATAVLGMLSAAGLPPLSGFWSKLVIVMAVWNAGFRTYAAIAVMASLLTLAYFLTMQRKVFFGPLETDYLNLKEANFWCLFPALMLAAITLALGVAGPWLFETFLMPVGSPL